MAGFETSTEVVSEGSVEPSLYRHTMAYIPPDAKWYVAELVIAISVGTRNTRCIHINTVSFAPIHPTKLTGGARPWSRRAIEYQNAGGETVWFRFLGLARAERGA